MQAGLCQDGELSVDRAANGRAVFPRDALTAPSANSGRKGGSRHPPQEASCSHLCPSRSPASAEILHGLQTALNHLTVGSAAASPGARGRSRGLLTPRCQPQHPHLGPDNCVSWGPTPEGAGASLPLVVTTKKHLQTQPKAHLFPCR